MKRKLLIFCLLCLPMFVVAQQEDPQEEIKNMSADLGPGQYLDMGPTGVEFLKVISDSRCPKQVTCIWPGEAKVLLGITVNGEYFEKELVVSGGGAEFQLANDFLMQVSHLRPYPETAKKIAPEEYCLRFVAAFPKQD